MRIETAAMTSGSRARNDAKTKISTTSAPAAPNSVSVRTPGPEESPPADNMPYDVRLALEAGRARRLLQRRLQLHVDARAERRRQRALEQGVRRAPVLGQEALVAGAGVVDQPATSGSPLAVDAKTFSIAAWLASTVCPSRHRHHRDERVERAGAVGLTICAPPCHPADRARRSPARAGRRAGRRRTSGHEEHQPAAQTIRRWCMTSRARRSTGLSCPLGSSEQRTHFRDNSQHS